jgi:hypothetical protein
MNDTTQSAEDLAILEQLNLDYNHSDQASDAKRAAARTDRPDRPYGQLLVGDFRHR